MDDGLDAAATYSETATVFTGGDVGSPGSMFAEHEVGASLGRYVVLEVIGRGAMGHVLRAYDPKLQREVALKLVSHDALDDSARDRMLREARAMAQLSHPNVVAVYDAEETDAGVMLVMEYVAGQTLRRWRDRPRPWMEIVACHVAAGRGLAAAHATGLLHRDFKPANVLVADSGAVKVTDFGLAKLATGTSTGAGIHGSIELPESLSGERLDESTGASLDGDLTHAGTVMGTPRYMAPEQHRGLTLGPAADQYAFCVTLWESLTGQPPHTSRALDTLLLEKHRGTPSWPSSGGAVPASMVDALIRGLSVEPQDRWPSMEDLLAALAHEPDRSRSRRVKLLAGLGAAAVVAVAGSAWVGARAQRCTGARAQLEGSWDDDERDRVEAVLRSVGVPYVERVWTRTSGELDRYADDWVQMHTRACEATTVRGEQSPEVMDLRMACLRRAREELSAVVTVLGQADEEVVRNATTMVDRLVPVERCADIDALQAAVEPPSAREAATVGDVRRMLARVKAELSAGRYAKADTEIEHAADYARQIEYPPVKTELLLAQGEVDYQRGRYEASERSLLEALSLALRWKQWGEAQTSATRLMYVVGYKQQRIKEGLRYWELAEGLIHGDPSREARARSVRGHLWHAEGKYELAEQEHRAVLTLYERMHGPRHLDVATARNNLGNVLRARGHFDEAEAEYRQVLALREELLGPEHPHVAAAINNIGLSLDSQSRHEQAEAEHRRALELRLRVLVPEHPDVTQSRNNLANALRAQGKLDEAEREYRLSLEVRERIMEPGHPEVAKTRANLANVLDEQGKGEEAETHLRRALADFEGALGPEHPYVAATRHNLAVMLNARGKYAEAEQQQRTALALQQQSLGLTHPQVANSHNSLGNTLLAQGKYTEAEQQFREALALQQEALGEQHPEIARSRYNLATVMEARGEYAQAEIEFRRSLTLRETLLGAEHPDVATSRHGLAVVLHDRGEHERAEIQLRQALALRESVLGGEHPTVADSRTELARVLLARGKRAEALAMAEQAWARRQHHDIAPKDRAAAAFVLARALDRGPGARARVQQLGRQAQQLYEEAGPGYVQQLEEVRAWLVERGLEGSE